MSTTDRTPGRSRKHRSQSSRKSRPPNRPTGSSSSSSKIRRAEDGSGWPSRRSWPSTCPRTKTMRQTRGPRLVDRRLEVPDHREQQLDRIGEPQQQPEHEKGERRQPQIRDLRDELDRDESHGLDDVAGTPLAALRDGANDGEREFEREHPADDADHESLVTTDRVVERKRKDRHDRDRERLAHDRPESPE